MRTKHRLVDAAMVLLLPLLMAYSLIGEAFHEFAGTLMLLLFLAHHWLNRAWLKNLFRGKYTALRSFQTCLNLLLLVFMIVQPLCGILMSKHLYTFRPTEGLSSLARAVHLPLANWGFVLMCLHAGMHLGSMLPKDSGKKAVLIPLGAVSLYGVYAFFKRQIPKYMFLTAVCFLRLRRAVCVLPAGLYQHHDPVRHDRIWSHTAAHKKAE